jgi:hypothetical protein
MTLLIVPTAVTVALGVALFAGALGIQWVVVGGILVGPLVATAVVAFEGLKRR